MDLHLFQDKEGTVHIHELVGEDLVHIDSPHRLKTEERIMEYIDECGIYEDPDNPIPTDATLEQKLLHLEIKVKIYAQNNLVLSAVATAVDALGVTEDYQDEIVNEVRGYTSIPKGVDNE